MARLRSAPATQVSAPPAQATRQALKEKTNTTRTNAPVYEDDGDADGLIKNARPKRGLRKRKANQNEDELVMAGGLGAAQAEDVVQTSEPPITTDELAKSDGPPPPTAKATRRPPRITRKVVQSEAQSKVMEDMRKRMQSTAQQETSKRDKPMALPAEKRGSSSGDRSVRNADNRKSTNSRAERSEFSLSPSPPPPGKLSAVKKDHPSLVKPGSAQQSQQTPAVENSILALKNFKRRPRQPSMLQMVQQRLASARPSMVDNQTADDPNVYDPDDGADEVEEEFAPEAEGTPQHLKKAKATITTGERAMQRSETSLHAAQDPITSSRKRKSDVSEVANSVPDKSRAKRTKLSTSIQEARHPMAPQQKVSKQPSSSQRTATPPLMITSEVQVINSSPSSSPPTDYSSAGPEPRSTDRDAGTPSTTKMRIKNRSGLEDDIENEEEERIDGTMAEPVSSSPLPEDAFATQRTDIMAEPLTQVSPPRPERAKPKKAAKSKPMTTATLQSLLPKRRQPLKPRHRKSEYDIGSSEPEDDDDSPLDTSHLEDDEDELGGRLRRQTKTASTKSKKATMSKAKSRQSKAAPSNRKSTAVSRKSTTPATANKTAKKSSRTYGRATASDKENEAGYESLDENDDSALPDTSVSMIEAAQSKELEEARKKFAEVDDWDMDFESMSVEEGRSSSQNWR